MKSFKKIKCNISYEYCLLLQVICNKEQHTKSLAAICIKIQRLILLTQTRVVLVLSRQTEYILINLLLLWSGVVCMYHERITTIITTTQLKVQALTQS